MLVATAVVAFLLMAPMFVTVMMISLTTAASDCVDQQQSGLAQPSVVGAGTVRVAHANIKVSLPLGTFNADLDQTLGMGPDLVSLNEVARRSDRDLERRGYQLYRAPNRGDDGSAVMWRTDRWTRVDAGRVERVARGPQKWDYDRGATWVTMQSAGVEAGEGTDPGSDLVSMVSLHHMINPRKYGPDKPLRQLLYREGLEKVQALVTRLSATGPVVVAGDFNSQYSDNDPWGPRTMLGAIGMKSTFDQLGKETTHDGGGTIDYLFYQSSVATPTRQWVRNLNSDHRLVIADLAIGASSSGDRNAAPASYAGDDEVRRRLMQVKLSPATPGYPTMSAEHADNSIAIGQVALEEPGLPRRALEIAIATAIQESKLANLDGGDRDSAGLFQQRPSTGWGSHDQVTDPRLATLAFLGRAEHTNNPGLLDVPGWASRPLAVAAQAVQRSGYPNAYAQWEAAAQEIAAILAGGDLGSPLNIVDAASESSSQEDCASESEAATYLVGCPPTGSTAEEGLTPDALLVLRCVDSQFGPHAYGGVGERATNPESDHPAGRAVDIMINSWNSPAGEAEGTRIAEWVREHAQGLGVTYIIWRAKIWSLARSSEGWRPYQHPSGANDPTSLHHDHVHVSVHGNAGTGMAVSDPNDLIVYPVPPHMSGSDARNWHESGPYWSQWHTGTDFSVQCGTPVVAAHAGTIEIDRSQSWSGRWLVKVTTGASSLATWYAHMHTLTVDDGDQVLAGQQIGEVGGDSPRDGNVSGCHLHFEVHLSNGSSYGPDNVDPSQWLSENARRAQ